MFGSFLLGLLGFLLKLVGLFTIGLGYVAAREAGHPDPLWLGAILGLGLIFIGSYLKYVSRQTVRHRD